MCKVGATVFAAALAAVSGFSSVLFDAAPARAETCPGNPVALGTSRVLVVSPQQYQRLGSMQYKETLPLADKEVVLTFDDGPLPPWSNKVLDILNAQCVKVSYFLVGEMAHNFPDVVRREEASGDTIGTHSQSHPTRFEKLTGDKLNYQIDTGIASVSAALSNPHDLAPFFRIPGLGRSQADEEALAARSLVVFSVDVVADDWFRHISPEQIVERAMRRLERRGSGILLLHDIHEHTALALPELLKELKDHGFHVVQVVPAAPTTPTAPSEPVVAGSPQAQTFASAMPEPEIIDEGSAAPAWPHSSAEPEAEDVALAAPDAAAFDIKYSFTADVDADGEPAAGVQWPKLSEMSLPSTAADLPVPGLADIGVNLQGQKLVGDEAFADKLAGEKVTGEKLGLRPSLDDHSPPKVERVQQTHLHAHHPVHAHNGSGKRA
jgi:peptidoglycan-N-acetylglucosamine deacetylase